MPTALQDDQDQEAQKEINESGFDIQRSKEQQAELDSLNANYEVPSATSEDRESNSKIDSEDPETPETKDLFNSSESRIGANKAANVFNRTAGWIKGNPLKASGSGLGIVGLFAAIFISMTSFGPLQFIHLSEILRSTHFGDSEATSNNRVRKLYQYVKSGGKLEETNLGLIGNKIASKVEANMAKNGWTVEYRAGKAVGMVYEEKGVSKNERKKAAAAKAKELTAAGFKNIPTPEDGKLRIPMGQGIFNGIYDRAITRNITGNSEYGKITSAVLNRLMYKRFGQSLNPITRYENKKRVSIAEKIEGWKKTRAEAKAAKAPAPITAESKKSNKEPQTDAEKAQASADAENTAKTNNLLGDGKTGKLTKGGLTGAAGIGLLCVVKELSTGADTSRMLATKIPLMKDAAEAIAIGPKIMAGDGDVDPEILGALSDELNSESGGSWTEANSLQYALGNKDTTGAKLPDNLHPNPAESELSKTLKGIPGIDNVCSVLMSPLGIAVTTIGSIATGAGLTATAIQALLAPVVMSGIENLLSTDPVDLSNYTGGVRGEILSVGTAMISNETNATVGGAILSNSDVKAYNAELKQIKKDEDRNRSIADKYLNPYKYDTATAKIIDNTNTKNIASVVISLPKSLLSTLPNLFSSKVVADNEEPNYSDLYYGMSKVGFTTAMLDSVENPYENASEVKLILKKNPKLIEQLKACNNITVDPDTLDFTYDQDSTIPSYERLSAECKDNSNTDMNKLRIAALDTATIKAIACYSYDDEESCNDITGQNSSDSSASSTTSQSTPSSYGPFVFPIQASKEEILKNGSNVNCLTKIGTDCHGTRDIGYLAADLFIKEGVPILSATNGTVVNINAASKTKNGSDTMMTITIKADDCDDTGANLTCLGKGTVFWYGHMITNSAAVKEGQRVTAGQQIGVSGGEKEADYTSPHLHFDASNRKNQFRGDCSRNDADKCAALGMIDIQPNLYEAFSKL